MQILCIVLGVLSLLATVMLSNLFGWGFREARAIGTLLHSRELLLRVVTPEVLNNPSGEIARYGKPMAGGYALTILAFRKAHDAAHARARAMVRPLLVLVVVGSGVVGFLAIGWLGLALPIVNFLVVCATFAGSMQGSIGSGARARAVEYVQIVAFILYHWHAKSPQEAAEWVGGEPLMRLLWEHLIALQGQD